MVSNGDALELSCSRNNLQQTSKLSLLREGFVEDSHGFVMNIVVRSDHTQVKWGDIHLVDDFDSLRLSEIIDCGLDKFREIIRDVVRRVALHLR